MIEESLNLQDIIVGFEQALRIDYTELKVEEVVKQVRKELYTVFNIQEHQTLHEAIITDKYAATSVDALRKQLVEILKSFCVYMQTCIYNKSYGKTVRDYNYIGLSEKAFLVAMSYLQDKELYEKKSEEIMDDLKNYINALDSSLIKRLLVIMEILYSLGFDIGVAVIAQFLYLGGL